MKLKLLTASILTATFLTACGGSSSSSDSTQTSSNLENIQKVLNTNADIALAAYNDSVDTAKTLQTAITAFKADPTEATLQAAKDAWLIAREPYGQTEVFRFRLSPIDSTNYKDEDGPEGDINAWPLGEALIDYVSTGNDFGDDQLHTKSGEGAAATIAVSDDYPAELDYPTENIINSGVEINEALLTNTASNADERDVIAGYHAIEFMLWGQDLNADGNADTLDNRDASGGQRPLSDFTTDQYAARRFQFLEVVTTKLIADLETVRNGWLKDEDNYRKQFTTVTTEEEAQTKLKEILQAMGDLSDGELAGERINIALQGNSQEDEHSCFSDNTHRDIWLNAEGISNVYFGEYAGYNGAPKSDTAVTVTSNAVTNGYGIDDYLQDSNLSSLKTDMESSFATTKTNYIAIDTSARQDVPVDILISTNNRTDPNNPLALTQASLQADAVVIGKIIQAVDTVE